MTRDEADSRLRQAIIDHAEAHGMIPEGEMLSEYGIVAAWVGPEDVGRHNYTLAFHSREVPAHVGVGLFTVAADLVMNDEPEDD